MIDILEPLRTHFDTVSLDELNRRARLMNRMETKYLLASPSDDEMIEILEALYPQFSLLSIGGTALFTYETVCFDSDSLISYRAHAQGRRKRFKIRSRHYVESGLTYFEVKMKGRGERTIKKRMAYDDLLRGQVSPAASAFVRRSFREVYGEDFAHELRPSLTMRYKRMTLVGKNCPERVTMDFDLTYVGGDGRRVVPSDCTIIEVKSEGGKGLADQVMRASGVRRTRCSKYCVGLNLTRPGLKYNRFKQVLRTYFGWPLEEPERLVPYRPNGFPVRALARIWSPASYAS